MEKAHNKRRWQAYFHELLNEGDKNIVLGDLEHSDCHQDFGYHRCSKLEIQFIDGSGRVIEPNGILA